MTRFICLKQGNKYGIDYVNILHNRVRHNLHNLDEFVCYTDTPELKFDDGITVKLLPDIPEVYGWWWKCWILAQHNPGRNLYMDLDMLIVGDCDVYRPLGDGLTGLLNAIHLNSSILAWNHSVPEIWTRFEDNKSSYLGAEGIIGDQEVINDTVEYLSLELHYWDIRYTAWLDVKTPDILARNMNTNTRTIVCKGPRNPHEHLDHQLVKAYWRKI